MPPTPISTAQIKYCPPPNLIMTGKNGKKVFVIKYVIPHSLMCIPSIYSVRKMSSRICYNNV